MIAAACFVGGVLIVPNVMASDLYLKALAPTVRTLALIAAGIFGLVALVKRIRESQADRTADRLSQHLAVVARTRQRTHDRAPQRMEPRVDPISREPTAPMPPVAPSAWSLALLQSIEWKRFEEVVAAYFRAKNFRCETLAYGPDGGIDGRLYFGDLSHAVGVVQCKAWGQRPVGVAPVRELLGVMAHEKVTRGYVCATGGFSNDAIAFAATNPIKLISGRDFIDAIAQMPEQTQRELLAVSTTGEYTTPTCPACGIKLVARTIGGKSAWGCHHYPRCRVKIFRKSEPTRA